MNVDFFTILINNYGNNLNTNNGENYVDRILYIKSIKHLFQNMQNQKFLCSITIFHNEGII